MNSNVLSLLFETTPVLTQRVEAEFSAMPLRPSLFLLEDSGEMLVEWHIGGELARSVLWDYLLVQSGNLWELTTVQHACFVHAPTHCGASICPFLPPPSFPPALTPAQFRHQRGKTFSSYIASRKALYVSDNILDEEAVRAYFHHRVENLRDLLRFIDSLPAAEKSLYTPLLHREWTQASCVPASLRLCDDWRIYSHILSTLLRTDMGADFSLAAQIYVVGQGI
jgi:hypothetical protein